MKEDPGHPFLRKADSFIRRHQLLTDGELCLVALSGGADSVALLLTLQRLGFRLHAAHCNFHLRGEESDRDEQFCRLLCQRMGIPLSVAHFATRDYAQAHHVSIEMAARALRYDYFERLREDLGAAAIAVAHHRDDSVETMLLNLIRGTGLHGLTGISPRQGKVVRPLLCVSRSEIEAALHEWGEPFVTDSSNGVDDVVRNKIRLRLLPLMREINPSVAESLDVTASRLRQVADVFDEAMDRRVEEAGVETGIEGRAAYQLDKMADEYTLFYILSRYGFTPAAAESIYACLQTPRTGALFTSSTHEALIDRGLLLVQPKDDGFKPMRLPVEGKYMVTEKRWLHIAVRPMDETFCMEKSPMRAYMDADKVRLPLFLRRTGQGDSFLPFGMKGRKLVSDFLTDQKVNLFDKRSQLVLTDADDSILWVVGRRADNRYRLDSSTKRVLIATFG